MTITCTEDFRRLYKARVPKMFHDYAESGSYTESTFRRNEADFTRLNIRQRVGVDISEIDTKAQMAGEDAALPVAFAPVGMLGIQNIGGEIKVAQAAKQKGVPFILSTMSVASVEQVAEATRGASVMAVNALGIDPISRIVFFCQRWSGAAGRGRRTDALPPEYLFR